MAGSEITPGLEALVARGPLRAWAERAAHDLELGAQRTAPPARIWKTAEDERVRQTHHDADGQAIAENLKFVLDKPQAGPTAHGQASRAVNGGGQSGNVANKASEAGVELARYPRDESLSPANRANCRCLSVTAEGMVAATVHSDGVHVEGGQVTFSVSTGFNRAAESEFGDGDSPGLRWMGRALNTFKAGLA